MEPIARTGICPQCRGSGYVAGWLSAVRCFLCDGTGHGSFIFDGVWRKRQQEITIKLSNHTEPLPAHERRLGTSSMRAR